MVWTTLKRERVNKPKPSEAKESEHRQRALALQELEPKARMGSVLTLPLPASQLAIPNEASLYVAAVVQGENQGRRGGSPSLGSRAGTGGQRTGPRARGVLSWLLGTARLLGFNLGDLGRAVFGLRAHRDRGSGLEVRQRTRAARTG